MRRAILTTALAILALEAAPSVRRAPRVGSLSYIYTYYDQAGRVIINNLPPSYVSGRGYTLKSVTVGSVRPMLTRTEFGRVLRSPELIAMVDEIATSEGVDPHLARAVIQAESAFYKDARSRAGALGLMQLMPATAERFGVLNPFDAKQNILGGVKYLRWLMDRFQNNLEKVIAAYNAGEGAVEKHGGIPPYAETRAYVPRVLSLFRNRSVQPDPKATGSMSLLQKGQGGFEVVGAATRQVASALAAAPAVPMAERSTPRPPSRLYVWRDKSGTLNLTDSPPPPGIKELKLAQD